MCVSGRNQRWSVAAPTSRAGFSRDRRSWLRLSAQPELHVTCPYLIPRLPGRSAAGLFDWVIVARGLELFEGHQGTVDHEGEIERVIRPAR